ncbi:MAG: hypothetical protein AAGL89_15625 [Pseudomonadota bacterium]
MKRRDFLRGAAASAGLTALPVPALSAPAVAVRTAPGLAAFHYGWACVFAQMNNGITPADVSDKFGVSLREANALFDRMRLRGVIHPPGLDGRSHATRPWQPWDQRAAAAKREKTDAPEEKTPERQTGKRARLKFKGFMLRQREESDILLRLASKF